ncbi:hypothetical protein NDU88_001825 [Pleurodeles waltl]|uniref:Uncharacterized protein n=1 Tax=Pleurodeles waltl TaxID=8319 RepID=A0AAV7NGU8_PLEWA|nr:hypothetical protein NDU88_001825 [Pleurodeles waltl]
MHLALGKSYLNLGCVPLQTHFVPLLEHERLDSLKTSFASEHGHKDGLGLTIVVVSHGMRAPQGWEHLAGGTLSPKEYYGGTENPTSVASREGPTKWSAVAEGRKESVGKYLGGRQMMTSGPHCCSRCHEEGDRNMPKHLTDRP